MRISRVVLVISAVVILAPLLLNAQVSRTCGACGQEIEGTYFETGNTFYHPHCFSCSLCRRPIEASYVVYRGKNYHTECFESNVALRCSVCGDVIQGEYLMDYWGNATHPHHKGEVMQCDFCQRFLVGALSKGGVRYSDGRRLCGNCRPGAVTRVSEAKDLMFEVAGYLEKSGLEVDLSGIMLHLVPQGKLRELSQDSSGDMKGFVDYTAQKNLFGRVKNKKIDIYLLYGMPRTQMASSIAHELTHVWQFSEGRLEQDRALSEGSCNYSAYLVLRNIGNKDAEFLIENMLTDSDPVYGEGFRRVKRYVDENGLAAWRSLMKKKNPAF